MLESIFAFGNHARWIAGEHKAEKQQFCLLIECHDPPRQEKDALGNTNFDIILLDLRPLPSDDRRALFRLVAKAPAYRITRDTQHSNNIAAGRHDRSVRMPVCPGRRAGDDITSRHHGAAHLSVDTEGSYGSHPTTDESVKWNWARAERRLTPRQYEILMALKNGESNKEIGRRLGILESTVKAQLKAIYRHLRVSNRTQAAILAAKM